MFLPFSIDNPEGFATTPLRKICLGKPSGEQVLTLVLLRGVVPTPLTVIALVLKIAQPRGKIAPGTFKFILSLHFREKNFQPTTYTGGGVSFQSWEVRGGGWCDPMSFELDILKIFEVICTHKFVCKLELSFSNIFCKKSHENRMFLRFFT